MAKFLTFWKTDMSRVPEDPKKQAELFNRLIEMVKKDLKDGITKQFGIFLNGASGYTIEEGTEEEVNLSIMRYIPYVKVKVFPFLSVEQLEENMKKLAQEN